MNIKRRHVRAAWGLGIAVAISVWGGPRALAAGEVADWNAASLTILATGGQNAVVQSWSMAMVHLAVHDALNAIDRRYAPYAFDGQAPPGASHPAAIAAAAHDVLVAAISGMNTGSLPSDRLPTPGFGTTAQQTAGIAAADAAYTAALAAIPDGFAKANGVVVGRAAAAALLARRRGDGATANLPYTPGTGPGQWQPTPNPVPPDPAAGGAGLAPALLTAWGNITPFILTTGAQFRPDGPPALTSEAYARDYNEIKSIGEKSSAARSAEQSSIARYWYEGSVAGWNRITRVVAAPHNLNAWDSARLFALVNAAMADGFIAGFNTRYVYNLWRPVTAIRAGDLDGNDATTADPNWQSFLNTPAIPDYPSTHSVLGGAAAEVLARFFGRDQIPFTMTSGAPFAGLTRSFTSLSQAAQENADSRVYAGIHFRSACRDGVRLGNKIGAFAVEQSLK